MTNSAKSFDTLMGKTSSISPSSPVAESTAGAHTEASAAAHGLAAVIGGHHYAMASSLVRAVVSGLGIGSKAMSDNAARQLTDMLVGSQPQQAINIMRARGAHEADLAKLRTYINMAAGAAGAHTIIGH